MGLSMHDLELLDVGMVIDMMIESSNDSTEYARIATQEDFNKF